MSPQHSDYILRMIAAAAAIARRLRERLAGGARADEVAREARTAQGELLGRDATLLMQLDPQSAAVLLGDPRRVEGWAELLRVEAAALRAAAEPEQAALAERRAAALLSAAARLPGATTP